MERVAPQLLTPETTAPGAVGPPPAPLVCERRMFFRDGMVVDQQWNGDPHYCETFKRR